MPNSLKTITIMQPTKNIIVC